MIDAAHIVPVNHEQSTDETRNGLARCALHHRAYDQALVTVKEDYSVVVNETQAEQLEKTGLANGLPVFRQNLLATILYPTAVSDRPHVEFLKLANQIRGWP